MTTVHEGIKLFKCSVCDVKFANIQNLRKHVTTVHAGIKPFKCSICDVNFVNKQSLKKH